MRYDPFQPQLPVQFAGFGKIVLDPQPWADQSAPRKRRLMGRPDRYKYLGDPRFYPKTDDCPECTEPSKPHFIGAKTVDGVGQKRYNCEHGHEWIVKDTTSDD